MAREERNKVMIAAEVTKDQKEVLEEICKKLDRPLSWIIRDSLDRYITFINGDK